MSNNKCCVLLQVVHPTVQELTDIAANCFTVSLSVGVLFHFDHAHRRLQSCIVGQFVSHSHTCFHAILILSAAALAPILQAQDLLRMERILLDSLQWRIKTPTAYNFLHLYTQGTAAKRAASSAQPASEPLTGAVVAKAAYLIELALMDYNMLRFGPSLVAASALMLSESWSPQGAAVDEIKLLSGECTVYTFTSCLLYDAGSCLLDASCAGGLR